MYVGDNPEPTLPQIHGIVDRETGVAKATEAMRRLLSFTAKAFPAKLDFGVPEMTLMSLLTRAHSFHGAALASVEQNNPFAAFTLIRSYAENAAVLVWFIEHPVDIARFYPGAPLDTRLRIGRITGGAGTRFGEFRGIYDQLSKFAHPDPHTALSGWHSDSADEMKVRWQSAPAFKNDNDFMMACVWLVELAEANANLWRECFEMYFGSVPTAIAPTWINPSPSTQLRSEFL